MPRHPLLRRAALVGATLALPVLIGCGTDYEEPDATAADAPSTVTTTVPPSGGSDAAPATDPLAGTEPTPLLARDGSLAPGGDGDEPLDAPTEPAVVPAPDPHQAYREAEAAYARGDHDLAIDLLRSSIAAREEFGHAHYLLGLAYRRTGEPARAEGAFEAALERMPDHHRARVNLARAQLDQDRPEDALATLQVAIDASVISDDLRNVEGRALLELGRLEAAEAAFLAAIEIHPGNVYALNNAGLCRIRMGRHADAVPLLTEASLLDGAPSYVWNNLGHALEHEGRVAGARDAFARAADAGHATAPRSMERVEAWLAAHPEWSAPALADATSEGEAGDALPISVEAMGAVPSDEPLARADLGSPDPIETPADAAPRADEADPMHGADLDQPHPPSPSGSAVDHGDVDDR